MHLYRKITVCFQKLVTLPRKIAVCFQKLVILPCKITFCFQKKASELFLKHIGPVLGPEGHTWANFWTQRSPKGHEKITKMAPK